MTRIAFADGHLHSNPVRGMGITSIGKRFINVGGWFIALVSLPPHHFDLENTFDGYLKTFEVLIRECNNAKSLGLKVVCLAGIHPAAITDEVSKDPKQSAKILEKALAVIDHIARLIKNGLIDGFGEIGRPHYKAIPEAFTINNIVVRYTLTLAKDLAAFAHLHIEQGGEPTTIDIEEVIRRIGIDKKKVVLHHLDVMTSRAAQKRELVFTVPGKYPVLKEVFKLLRPSYMIESDFIDDPKRPGVSSYPWDIIENQKKLLTEGIVDEEYLFKINVDVISEVYGVEPP